MDLREQEDNPLDTRRYWRFPTAVRPLGTQGQFYHVGRRCSQKKGGLASSVTGPCRHSAKDDDLRFGIGQLSFILTVVTVSFGRHAGVLSNDPGLLAYSPVYYNPNPFDPPSLLSDHRM